MGLLQRVLLIFGSVYTRKPKTFQNGLQVDYDPDDLAFDQQHIWHPYTSMTRPLPVYPVASAHGCELHLASGEPLVDGMSSGGRPFTGTTTRV